jgi:ActR/RegA family two-component response regulator
VNTGKKTVLLVDDDAQFLELLQSLLRAASNETWEVISAQTTALALTILQTQQVDLAVIGIRTCERFC